MSATHAPARPPTPRLVALSDRLYRALLLAYPAAFRRAYGAEMAQVFRTSCREAERAAGLGGVLRLWLPTLRDLAVTALAERFAGGGDMARSVVQRGTALVGALGGVLWLLMLGAGVVLAGLAALRVLVLGPSLFTFVALPSVWAFFLIGLVGLHARLAQRGGWLVWLAFVVAAAGALMLFAGGVGMGYVWYSNSGIVHHLCGSAACQQAQVMDLYLYQMDFLGYPVLGVGMIASGLLAVRGRLLPRHNALVLVLGVLIAAQYFFTDMGAPALLRNTNPGEIVMGVETIAFIVVWGVGWIMLGRQLWRNSPETAPAGTAPAPETPLAPVAGA